MEESKSESVKKRININKEKDYIDETDYEEPLVTDYPVINEPKYFNLLECGKNFLNRLDDICEQACMATSRNRYYKGIFGTLTDYNDRKNTTLSNANI